VLEIGTSGTETAFDRGRQVSTDAGSLITIVYSLVYLAIFLYLLNWFYHAVKRIEESLQRIEKRLDAIEASPTQPRGPSPPASSLSSPPQGVRKRERISNMWVIPAILFIAAIFSGALGLTLFLLYAASVMLIAAAVWEVVRREARLTNRLED
jgi:hypothetical protein